jgi:hypothetical protein
MILREDDAKKDLKSQVLTEIYPSTIFQDQAIAKTLFGSRGMQVQILSIRPY